MTQQLRPLSSLPENLCSSPQFSRGLQPTLQFQEIQHALVVSTLVQTSMQAKHHTHFFKKTPSFFSMWLAQIHHRFLNGLDNLC